MGYSKNKPDNNATYDKLKAALLSGEIGRCYVFHGEEQYLLGKSLEKLRNLLCPSGLDSFNYKRFDSSNISIDMLEDAIDMLPVFSERTLIEVHDYDVFSSVHRERLASILSSLPEYICIVFIYRAKEYKPDGRLKTTKDILKTAAVVEFDIQNQSEIVKWIKRHLRDGGKSIDSADAEYLSFITGGLMTTLFGEIRKIAAFAKGELVTRKDIDAVVIPVIDAKVYALADAIIKRDNKAAMQILDELLQMREAPHKLLFSISMKLRQLLAARVCIDCKLGKSELKSMCGIYHDFQARILIDTARHTTLQYCKKAVLMCSQTAKELNSMSEPEARIIELAARLALMI